MFRRDGTHQHNHPRLLAGHDSIDRFEEGGAGRFERRRVTVMSKATRILFVVTVLNFGVWGVVNCFIHGDAFNGKIQDGKYYVAAKGKYTEVTRSVYWYSYVHTWTNFVLFPATILSGLLGMRFSARKAKRGREEFREYNSSSDRQ